MPDESITTSMLTLKNGCALQAKAEKMAALLCLRGPGGTTVRVSLKSQMALSG